MRTIQVLIQGDGSLLQHRFGEEAQASSGTGTRAVKIAYPTPREQAEKSAYRKNDGNLYLPGAAIARLLREAGGSHKQKGSRKSCKYIVPAACRVRQDQIPLFDLDGVTPLDSYEVDSRPVTIPSTKGRIMRHRPRLDEWTARFDLVVNEEVLEAQTIHQFLIEGGQRIGVGDFRPERGGPFGCFKVTHWEDLEVSEATPKISKPKSKVKKKVKKA